MGLFDQLAARLTAPKLTRGRMAAAMTFAFLADLLQIALMPVAWTFAQSAVDVVAMVLVMSAIGFHLLLLPTFILEFIPGVDVLPTWTACVIAVVALRKRGESTAVPPAQEVESTVQRETPPNRQVAEKTAAPVPPARD